MRNRLRAATRAKLVAWAVLMLVQAACDEASDPVPGPTTTLRVLHTAAGVSAVDVFVGASAVIRNLAVGDVRFVSVTAGTRQVSVRPAGSSDAAPETAITFIADDSVTMLTMEAAGVLTPWELSDTGAVVPADKSKLRVVHAAAGAPAIDIWRTQPDFATYLTIMFPFAYQATSPYIQSDPGDWRILVSTETRDGGGIPSCRHAAGDGADLRPGRRIAHRRHHGSGGRWAAGESAQPLSPLPLSP